LLLTDPYPFNGSNVGLSLKQLWLDGHQRLQCGHSAAPVHMKFLDFSK